jgi:hypothetical protein
MRIKHLGIFSSTFKLGWLGRILIFLVILLALTIGIRLALGNNVLGIDFFTFWMTGKAAFIKHLNPYSDSLVQQIQLSRYNRLALPGEDHLAFVYPLYMLLLVLPLSFLEYPLAQAIWLAIFILLVVTVLFSLFTIHKIWRIISTPFFYPFVFCIIIGNFTLLIFLIFLIFFWLHYSNKLRQPGWQSIMGIFLSFAAGKPQISYLLCIFCFLIILKYRYWRTLAWFTGSLVILIGGSFIIIPSWFTQWFSRLQDFTNYQTMTPPYRMIIDLFRNGQIHNYLFFIIFIGMIAVLVLSLVNWWRGVDNSRSSTLTANSVLFEPSPKELFILGLIGLITFIFHPTWFSYEQIIMYIPFFLWAATSPASKPRHVFLFWWTAMAVSWISFYLSSQAIFSQALNILPIIFFSIWLLYLLLTIFISHAKDKLNAAT